VRTSRYTLEIVKSPEGGIRRTSLFDNEEDPYQNESIATSHPDLVSELVESELNPWLRKTGDPWLDSTAKA